VYILELSVLDFELANTKKDLDLAISLSAICEMRRIFSHSSDVTFTPARPRIACARDDRATFLLFLRGGALRGRFARFSRDDFAIF